MVLKSKFGCVLGCIAALTLMGSCKQHVKPEVEIAKLVQESTEKEVRLPSVVKPKHYELWFKIDPASDSFEGRVVVHVTASRDTNTILLHADKLDIKSATLVTEEGKEVAKLNAELMGQGLLKLDSEDTLVSGKSYSIQIEYTGGMDEEPSGLYRTKDQDNWYAVTQFEPLEARKAFPCFDEPVFKSAYSVTVDAPANQVVAANAPLVSKKEIDGGFVRHVFGKTPPLASYLVALTVGPYDIVNAPLREGSKGPEFRVLVPKGKADFATYAVEQTPAILTYLEGYFDMPYPFEKLDFVAVPNFSAGAMENVGLVTFRDSILLLNEEATTPRQKHSTLNVIAHELAHMWFGNLVTPPWWDELWLNESFATWMAAKTVEAVAPELESGMRQVMGASYVMSADSLAQTRSIRQPIVKKGDIYNAFDGITYGKGALVLGMTENWLSEAKFKQGIQNMMKQQAYGAVTTDVLWASLAATSWGDVKGMMSTFIDQPGVPLVKVTPLCSGETAQYKLEQSRYVPAGSGVEGEQLWRIPVCIAFPNEQGERLNHCEVLEEKEQVVTLPVSGCPAWIHPNADERGYYHWSLPADEMLRLSGENQSMLTGREKLALLGHMGALVQSGQMDALTLYKVAQQMMSSDNDHLVMDSLDVFMGFGRVVEKTGNQKAYAELLRALLWPQLERLGMEVQSGEVPAQTNLRASVLSALADEGMDATVMSNAKMLMVSFLEDPNGFKPEHHWAVVAAATEGDEVLWSRLVGLLDEVNTPASRGVLLRALGSFREPVLLKRSADLFFDERIRSNEFWALVGPNAGNEALAEQVIWPWTKANYTKLVGKLGVAFGAPSLPFVGSGMCSREKIAEVKTFFETEVEMVEGMERNLGKALQSMEKCVVQRPKREEAITAFLSQWEKGQVR